MERVIAYIDGYNLYFGLKEGGFSRYKWLNLFALVQDLLKPNQQLIRVNYFTTIVTNDAAARQRQKTYLNALQTIEGLIIFYGKFQKERTHCGICGNHFQNDCEKMTDVAIATELMKDYFGDAFDMAMIVSGDTDLLPPIKFINEADDNKRVFVAFPPERVNDEVRTNAKGSMVIGRKKIADNQLPENVTNSFGETFTRPQSWI